MKTLNGYFDGQHVVLDEPAALKPNTRVKVVVEDDDERDADLVHGCARLSEVAFKKVWDNPLDADYDKL